MSTVSEAIISWLKQYNPSSYWSMPNISTDMQPTTAMSYALVKEPTVNIKTYVSGLEERTEYYQLSARLDTQTNIDRVDNGAWLEGLEKWVKDQDLLDNYPIISGADVSHIAVSSSFYLGQTDDNTSIYSITISIKYTIRRQ